jgi:hypothetical protein
VLSIGAYRIVDVGNLYFLYSVIESYGHDWK